MAFDFFYDEQIRRVLVQFMRVFSLIKTQLPSDDGTVVESPIPVRYGDLSRMAASILKNNSENTIIPSNMAAVSIKSIDMAPERRQHPYHVSTISIDERKFDNTTGDYGSDLGNRYTIERYMPVPYNITFQVDIWTTSTTTKLQILEQIMTIFNPSIDIQQHDNILDWSVMLNIEMTDIVWSNRSIPQGVESERDVASLTFKVPVWINPPAKVKTRRLIEQIVSNIFEFNAEIKDSENLNKFSLDPYNSCFDSLGQIIVTPGNFKIKIGIEEAGVNEIYLLNSNGAIDESLSWANLFDKYGEYREGISQIVLKTDNDIESDSGDIIGNIFLDQNRPNVLIFEVDVDTLPEPISISPVNQIINPLTKYPGSGLPAAAVGQKYLLLEDIPVNTGTNPWGSVDAKKNDIISFNGSFWQVVFDSEIEQPDQYVKSMSSYQHYKFNGNSWVHTYFGEYSPGFWKLIL